MWVLGCSSNASQTWMGIWMTWVIYSMQILIQQIWDGVWDSLFLHKFSGCWCCWAVDHTSQSSRGGFFSKWGRSKEPSWNQEDWLVFFRKAECGLVKERGLRFKVTNLYKDSETIEHLMFVWNRRSFCGIMLVSLWVLCTWENIAINL